MTNQGFLKTKGTKIVDANGENVVLIGTASGGHLNMENFITGYPGHETEHKRIMKEAMGEEKFNYFYDKFYEYFFTDKDAEFLKSLNLNCLRIPFNYRHFLDDSDLTKIKPEGFKLLDRIIDSCSKYGIYTVLDLHAAPGGQNQDWHSDSAIHKALFWEFGHFQDAVVGLWEKIADYYKDNTWIAGYNPLNEPAESQHTRLIQFYTRVEKAIRAVDSNHILFWDGNTYAGDFSKFPDTAFPNSVYAIHDYTMFGFPAGEHYTGTAQQKEKLKKNYESKIGYIQKIQAPVWNGEFGPVYSSEARGDVDIEKTNARRYHVLKDQLDIYKKGDPSGDGYPISWSIWVYKDIGYQGLTYVSPKSKWFQVLGEWFAKKKRLGIDDWGKDADKDVEDTVSAYTNELVKWVPEKFHRSVYPWKLTKYFDRITREILLSEFLSYEYAEYFKDLSFEELDEMAKSFHFDNVEQRQEIKPYLSQY